MEKIDRKKFRVLDNHEIESVSGAGYTNYTYYKFTYHTGNMDAYVGVTWDF
jgi:hypothetical protein